MTRDPRSHAHFSARDVEALVFIGEGFEVAQYQLHEAVFRGVSEVVVSRFVRRWANRGFLSIERWNNIGVNRLRLTSLCRDELVARGLAKESQLFVPRRAVALKDVAHFFWINDLRVVFREPKLDFKIVQPAWVLQRRLTPAPRAIPDLLAVRPPAPNDNGLLIAAEVDLGGERLNGVFLPKLARLNDLLREWAGEASAHIQVLTRGVQRAALLERFASETPEISMSVALLPDQNGREALKRLREIVSRQVVGVHSGYSDDLTPCGAEPVDCQQFADEGGVRLLEEEKVPDGYRGSFGFPRTREECVQRLEELAEEAREARFRLLQDDGDKEWLWRRLHMIRDYSADIQRALDDEEPVG